MRRLDVNQFSLQINFRRTLIWAVLGISQTGCEAIQLRNAAVNNSGLNNAALATTPGVDLSRIDQLKSISPYGKAIIKQGAKAYQGVPVAQLAESSKRGLSSIYQQLSRIGLGVADVSSSDDSPAEALISVDVSPYISVDPLNLGCSLWFRADASSKGGVLDCTAGKDQSLTDFSKLLSLSMNSAGQVVVQFLSDKDKLVASTAGAEFANFKDGLYHYLQVTVVTNADTRQSEIQLFIDNHGPYAMKDPGTVSSELPAEAIETQFQAIFSDAAGVSNLLKNSESNYFKGRDEFALALNAVFTATSNDGESETCKDHPGYAAGGNWNVRLYSQADCEKIGGNWVGDGECLDPAGGSFSAANAIWNSVCPGLASQTQLSLTHFQNETCIGIAVGTVRLFTQDECSNQLQGVFYSNGKAWGVDSDHGECLVPGGGSYSAILGSLNSEARCSNSNRAAN